MRKSTVLSHIKELRLRILFIIYSILLGFIIGIIFANKIILLILENLNIKNVKFVLLSPVEYIYIQLKVALLISLILCFPIFLYHIYSFLKPALNKKIRKTINYILISSIVLFIIGVLFGYLLLAKIGLKFFSNITPSYLQNLWSVDSTISFVLITSLMSGIVFELPLLIILLNKLGIVSRKMLSKSRRYVYVAIFIIAAIITPGVDIFSQILIALPLIILFEITMLSLYFFDE